jgi:hypothetical protein
MNNLLRFTLPALFLLAMPATGQELLTPDPNLPPERVVEIQLQSLQKNDVPDPDTGIAQTWAFAHPDNKRVTGPLERFTRMIKGPDYRNMLDHQEHIIKPVVQTDDYALFAVTIITADDQRMSFKWEVMKVQVGEFAGSWMTISVSPPLRARDST